MKKTYSIRLRMIGIMLILWLLPFLIISVAVFYSTSGRNFKNQIELEMKRLDTGNQVAAERMDQVVELSKDATYARVINNAITSYDRGQISQEALHQTINAELSRLYASQDHVTSANFWMTRDPEGFRASTYNVKTGSFRETQDFWDDDQATVSHLVRDLDTKISFYSNGRDKLYMVRNMLDSSYDIVGVLALRINVDYVLGNLAELEQDTDVTVLLNDMKINLEGKLLSLEDANWTEYTAHSGYYSLGKVLTMYDVEKQDRYTLTTYVRHHSMWPTALTYGYRAIIILLIIAFIPMMLLMLRLFRKYLTQPVEEMVDTVQKIQGGNLGYQSDHVYRIGEFAYLVDAINQMSKTLKYQFDHIYEEEIALRDARIMALQSHINPHFLNNTLEIINWEARLNHDDKVADMIGNLSVLTDSAMDRKKRSIIPMEEELRSVNAYLNILKMRFGDRLTVNNEIPQELMHYYVPRLILQPIIENAVEHGVAKNGTGTVTMQAKKEGIYLYLIVINDGGISEKEKAKIERLLAPDYDTSKESSGNLGIANVNQRLQILYGEDCGLQIEGTEENQVRSILTLLAREQE